MFWINIKLRGILTELRRNHMWALENCVFENHRCKKRPCSHISARLPLSTARFSAASPCQAVLYWRQCAGNNRGVLMDSWQCTKGPRHHRRTAVSPQRRATDPSKVRGFYPASLSERERERLTLDSQRPSLIYMLQCVSGVHSNSLWGSAKDPPLPFQPRCLLMEFTGFKKHHIFRMITCHWVVSLID